MIYSFPPPPAGPPWRGLSLTLDVFTSSWLGASTTPSFTAPTALSLTQSPSLSSLILSAGRTSLRIFSWKPCSQARPASSYLVLQPWTTRTSANTKPRTITNMEPGSFRVCMDDVAWVRGPFHCRQRSQSVRGDCWSLRAILRVTRLYSYGFWARRHWPSLVPHTVDRLLSFPDKDRSLSSLLSSVIGLLTVYSVLEGDGQLTSLWLRHCKLFFLSWADGAKNTNTLTFLSGAGKRLGIFFFFNLWNPKYRLKKKLSLTDTISPPFVYNSYLIL